MISKIINPVKRLLSSGVKLVFTFGIIFTMVFVFLNWQALYLRFFWQPPDTGEIEETRKKIDEILFFEEKIIGEDYQFEEDKKTEEPAEENHQKNKSKKNETRENLQEICEDSCLVIPKIKVAAPIIFSQSRQEKDIQNDLKNGVAHYADTSMPGDPGNCFITGHSSNYTWRGGNYNTVFVFLDKLEKGDEIFIYYNREIYRYEVIESFLVKPEQVEVLKGNYEPILTLMTCWPVGTNLKRLIVRAKLNQKATFQSVAFSCCF